MTSPSASLRTWFLSLTLRIVVALPVAFAPAGCSPADPAREAVGDASVGSLESVSSSIEARGVLDRLTRRFPAAGLAKSNRDLAATPRPVVAQAPERADAALRVLDVDTGIGVSVRLRGATDAPDRKSTRLNSSHQ